VIPTQITMLICDELIQNDLNYSCKTHGGRCKFFCVFRNDLDSSKPTTTQLLLMLMKKTIPSGLTTTALMMALGTTLFLSNGLSKTLASSTDQGSNQAAKTSNSNNGTNKISPTASIQNSVTPRFLSPAVQGKATITVIQPHAWQEGKLAVTLRVRNIPIMTFLGTNADLAALSNNQDLTSPDNPMDRAKAIADKINQLAQDPDFQAENIAIGFDKNTRNYLIQVNDDVLVSLDENTVLPDTTRNLGKDALQIANRLRRVMGNAEPLTSIAKVSQPSFYPSIDAPSTDNVPSRGRQVRGGMASWYGPGFHGRRTANGERYNQNGYTAAHKSLPFGTKVRVTNIRTGRSVMVRINDRGPFIRGRVIDLSAGAARVIGVHSSGTAPVQLEVLN
jgi:rare lipoprotein A